MPHQKSKTESYQNLGGINAKASPYITGQFQFLNITNMDFQTPGSLTKRWGSTQYLSVAASYTIQGFYEYEKLSGFSRIVLFGGPFVDFVDVNTLQNLRHSYSAGMTLGTINPDTQTVSGGSPWDFVTFADQMFAANGQNFIRFDGNTSYIAGIPPVVTRSAFVNGYGGSGNPGGMTGVFYYKFSYINNRGAVGPGFGAPFIPGGDVNNINPYHVPARATGATLIEIGINQATFPVNWLGHGVTAIAVYRTDGQPYDYSSTDINQDLNLSRAAQYAYLTMIPLGTTIFTDNNWQGITLYSPVLERQTLRYVPTTGTGMTTIASGETFVPSYLEIYNNRLAMSGFSFALSKVWISELGEPERIPVLNQFEVRTNDGDIITGKKTYNGRLYIFKQRSFHAFSGDNPDNFNLIEVSDQYGCLNNRCIVVYENTMLFLDRKGIARFNGASVDIISGPMQPYFDVMNIPEAIGQATMVHDRKRNQILIGIPINGSGNNNVTIVYDYLINAWTKYDGYTPLQYGIARGVTSEKTVFYSTSVSNMLYNVGPSFFADNKVGFTTYFKSRFASPYGHSTESQFRRLYLNFNNEISGSSLGVTIGLYVNYGSSIQIKRTVLTTQFQSRIDFGLSAKAMAFECAALNASLPLQFHGFAIEARYQRGT